ncbi:hypothetical protein SXCC_02980 [Gluconacetobacter sp. SXCC-1]|nr:hypothetical protein SXCC_02980 [Gluconacetobacter sp. SXCC-1]
MSSPGTPASPHALTNSKFARVESEWMIFIISENFICIHDINSSSGIFVNALV